MTNFLFFSTFLVLMNFCHHEPECPVPVNVNASLEESWASDTVLRTPESVLYDPARQVIFVANINQYTPAGKDGDGFISVLTPQGKVSSLHWITGLNDPKGMGISRNKVYVADINEVVEIDIHKAAITHRYHVDGALFLNDITVDAKGNVYISDTGTNKVHLLKGDTVVVFLESAALNGPNGLLAERERLIVANTYSGDVDLVDYNTKDVISWTSGIANADGIAKDLFSNYFISDWEGQIFYVKRSGEKTSVLDTKAAGINSADIDFAEDKQLLLVPTFFNNRVVAYKVNYSKEYVK